MSLASNWIRAAEAQLLGQDLTEDQDDAIVQLLELCVDDPIKALSVIDRVIHADPKEEILSYLGAGPMEDLLIHNCDLLETLIDNAKHDDRYKQCLSNVNLDQDDCHNALILQKYLLESGG